MTELALETNTAHTLAATTLVETVMATIRQRIAARSLTPGARLPSIRAFAKAMQVSKSTVVEAYERLAAEGAIRSRPGSGFYAAGSLAPLSLAEIGPRLDRAVDPLWVSRQSLEAGDDDAEARLRLAAGLMDAAGRLAPRAAHGWRAPTMSRSPTTARRSACRRCANCWRGAWPGMASKPRPTRSC